MLSVPDVDYFRMAPCALMSIWDILTMIHMFCSLYFIYFVFFSFRCLARVNKLIFYNMISVHISIYLLGFFFIQWLVCVSKLIFI